MTLYQPEFTLKVYDGRTEKSIKLITATAAFNHIVLTSPVKWTLYRGQEAIAWGKSPQ